MEKSIISDRNSNDIFLVAGATGRCGRFIVKSLLKRNKKVRILIKNIKKINEVFTDDEIKQLDKIIECDLTNDTNYKDAIKESFYSDGLSSVNYVISALSYSLETDLSSEQERVVANQRIIDAAVEHGKIKRFCLISSSHVTRPYSLTSIKKNLRKQYIQSNKSRVETYLRNTNLNYLIIRPVDITIEDEATNFVLTQGDKTSGHINASTVGMLTVDSILDPWIQENTTFECSSNKKYAANGYEYLQGKYNLRTDRIEDKKYIDHIFATRLIMAGMTGLFLTMAYVAYKQGKKHMKWEKFFHFLKRMVGRGGIAS